MEQLSTVRRVTLADEVYELLRGQIIEHRIGPGESLSIEAVSRAVGVSPTPVREALNRLASEGLATYESLVGFAVAPPLDAVGFDRLMEARFALEPELAALAAQRISSAAAEDLSQRAAIDGSETASDSTDEYARYRTHTILDAEFHRAVAEAASSPFLERAVKGLHAHVQVYRLHHPGDSPEPTLVEHLSVARAIERRDPRAARAAMRAHLDAAYHRHSAGLRLPERP